MIGSLILTRLFFEIDINLIASCVEFVFVYRFLMILI